MILSTSRRTPLYTIFDTKRTFFVFRLSGCTAKHFTKETVEDWGNEKHGDWECNPVVNMKRSGAKVFASVDRVFYYSGDTMNIKVFINMQEATKMNCTGLEVSLGRSLAIDGYRADKRNQPRKLYEITIIKSEKRKIVVNAGDRNEFEIAIKAPSIDELSFMPKFTDCDEEGVVQQWTPTCVGQVVTIRYFLYTRLVFDGLPYDKC